MKPLGPTDPTRVGQYRLLGKLGAGGMGSVYLARSDRGRTVAVKLVQPELAAQPEFRQRFQHEVDAARRVGGDWTAPVLDADTEAATPWVATGYVAGPSLHDVVTNSFGPLPERTLFILANGLVKALRDIHGAGLVHRDLKPSNVMITIDGPRVIDFGIARALESGEGLTRTGAAVGSPGFMSPEQCRGETLTPASDIFCLGSVLTFAATGRTPFGDANSSMTALMLAIVQGQYDLDGVPDGIRRLIEACLAQDPTQRPTLDQLHQYTDIPDDSGEPWLPGALVAQLGRHAVELLDSEDPMGDTMIGQPPVGQPTQAQPPSSGYGYPQPQPSPPHGYGYPHQATGGFNPYGPGTHTGAPPAPAKRNNVPVIVGAAVAVLAVAIGVAVFATNGGGDDPGPGPTATGHPTTTEEPTEQTPTEEPTEQPAGGTVPQDFVGAWEGEFLDGDNSIFVRMEISEGSQGDIVATQWSVLPQLLCVEEASLSSVNGGTISLAPEGVTSTTPADQGCNPFADQTATLQSDGTLRWELSDGGRLIMSEAATAPGSDGMPYAIFSGVYSDDDFSAEFGSIVEPGEVALTMSEPDGDCVWESQLVSGGTDGGTMLVGPGAVTAGDCDPLPSYRLDFEATDASGSFTGDNAPSIDFTPYGDEEPEFTLDRE
ncbi:serine/threonine-protein kinase [Streptomyces millisiae]|uniref:Serine/threonine-protein kinase n=1 Tax=Streptomyces millisiae TaxID=3075542 RepID=A0ABU2M1V7_9ACTN|nr:serine/threonine-protein kinase [Streptomyces sp. DSM 44918]MDT0323367.1 serine/threonine-protein kinase [Streptomyces sp. DSM 44918]